MTKLIICAVAAIVVILVLGGALVPGTNESAALARHLDEKCGPRAECRAFHITAWFKDRGPR